MIIAGAAGARSALSRSGPGTFALGLQRPDGSFPAPARSGPSGFCCQAVNVEGPCTASPREAPGVLSGPGPSRHCRRLPAPRPSGLPPSGRVPGPALSGLTPAWAWPRGLPRAIAGQEAAVPQDVQGGGVPGPDGAPPRPIGPVLGSAAALLQQAPTAAVEACFSSPRS